MFSRPLHSHKYPIKDFEDAFCIFLCNGDFMSDQISLWKLWSSFCHIWVTKHCKRGYFKTIKACPLHALTEVLYNLINNVFAKHANYVWRDKEVWARVYLCGYKFYGHSFKYACCMLDVGCWMTCVLFCWEKYLEFVALWKPSRIWCAIFLIEFGFWTRWKLSYRVFQYS